MTLVRDYGLLNEAELLPRSYGGNSWFGKFHPAAGKELSDVAVDGDHRRCCAGRSARSSRCSATSSRSPTSGRQADLHGGRGTAERDELNLYVTGYEDEPEQPRDGVADKSPSPGQKSRAKARVHESRLLAGLREPRVHARAARLDGEGRAAARHRADRARPRRLLRRRRDRRAQPGARRHAQRAHVRARAADRRRADDEHLLHLPGSPVRVPGAPRRQLRLPGARQLEPR